jgi:predicted Zn-dependent peptidase
VLPLLLSAVIASLSPAPRSPDAPPAAVPWTEPDPDPAPAATTAQAATTSQATANAVTTVVLDNGLTILLSENHERPEIFGAVVVRTGGKNDPADNTGMAHYLEHMLFKGTTSLGTTDWAAEAPLQRRLEELYEQLRTAKGKAREPIVAEIGKTVEKTYAYVVPNELDQLLEQVGGTGVNAFTSYDETVYHNTFPASQLEGWLAIYAHRFRNPVFRLFPTELEAVYEEKNIAIDTTGYELFRRFMRGAFPDHPYGSNDILGEVEHLKRPSLVAMKRYFETYYVPGNMALVLSGDFDVAEVLPQIEAEFGVWPKGETPPPTPGKVEPFDVAERLAVRLSPIRVGAIAYRTVPESHPDYAALKVARGLLTNEQRSGFVDRLSDEGKLLLAMHVPADFADHNVDVVAYVPRLITQSFRGAERLVREQFLRVARGDFDEAKLDALRTGLLVEEALRWEDNGERALAMAHAFVAHGGWQGHLDYLERLRTLDKAEVMRVAAELFDDRYLRVRSRMGIVRKQRLDKPATPAVKPRRGAHSDFYARMQTMPGKPPKIAFVDPKADLVRQPVGPGVTMVANGNPFDDIYTLQLRFGVGTEAIAELDLLAQYLGRVGSEAHRGRAFFDALAATSTTLSATAEPDRFIVELQGPQEHMDEALALLGELMATPAFERKPLRQVRREIWGYRRIARKDAVNVGAALEEHVLYGANSKYRRETGPAQARRIGVGRLERAWQRVQSHAVELGYVGREDPQQIATAFARHTSLPSRLAAAAKPVIYPRVLPPETTVYFVPRRDAVQTQLWFAVDGDALAPEEHAAADAFSEYFGGSMAGLVFQEIREFRALAYSASARYPRDEEPSQRGHLLGYVGCQADKTAEALEVMIGLIRDMPARPDRLELVRLALMRSQETQSPAFRDLQDSVRSWQRLGHTDDPRRALLPAYAELDFADIERFWRAHVEGRPIAIMVVGDPRKVKRSTLEKYGRVVRVREGALYRR